jgi:hypothetical protein
MIKKIIFFAVTLIFSNIVTAQVQVNLNVSSNPTPELFEWANRADLAILSVTNSELNLVGTEYKIKVRLLLDNELVLETNNNVIPQRLELGTQTFLADEIIPYDAVDFIRNSFKDKMIQTGLLPAGYYSFCVSLINDRGNPISTPAEVCSSMLITQYQLPELLFPIDDFELNAELAPTILFTWSPVSPQPDAMLGVKYILAITEVQPGQSVSQAFHVNYPIIEEEIIGRTQFNWPLDIDLPLETTQYVWSIKPVTFNDNPYKSGVNGFAYIETFVLTVPEYEEATTKLEPEIRGHVTLIKSANQEDTGEGENVPENEEATTKLEPEIRGHVTLIKSANQEDTGEGENVPENEEATTKLEPEIRGHVTLIKSANQEDTGEGETEEITKNLVNLTNRTSTEEKKPLSLKQQNMKYFAIKNAAEKLTFIKQNTINKGGNLSKKEKRQDLIVIKEIAKKLINLNPNNKTKKEKLADIKAMSEALVNLTIKN